MPFDPVDPKQSFPALEKGILRYWKEEDTFKRSIRERSAAGGDVLDGPGKKNDETSFSFFDGPPFATGLPHYGHLLAGTIKDVIPRYQTMRGKKVVRRFGWDCHGLPIENIIEKEHNLKSKQEIEAIGIRKFNELCRSTVQRHVKEWRTVVERMGRWVDMDWDYRTMDADYMESIWWVFKSLAEKKLIVEGHKPMHVCPRCVTPLSNFEVTQGYKDVSDLSATAMFRIKESEESKDSKDGATYILAWTTTPWTLPGNLFLAVHPAVSYVTVECEGKNFIVAESRAEAVFKGKEHAIVGKPMKGKALIGKIYEPLFPYFEKQYKACAFKVVDGKDFVTTEDGTGIVHIAPGFGEDDYNVGKSEGIDPPLQHVLMDGRFTEEVGDGFAGMHVKPKESPTSTDKLIIDWLKKNAKLFKSESYTHSYPHCWRCDSPLLNYATSSWFVKVEKIKESMLEANSRTEWVPNHIRDGRFGNWLENARDWAISRNRYWGTPLPIWRSSPTGSLEFIGSRDDVMVKKPIRFTKVSVFRHAESEGNLTPIYQGKVPGTSLTSRGKKQATEAAKPLSEEQIPVARIYCSPLARAQETAAAIAKQTGAEVIVDERLREVHFGEYEGKTVDFSDLTFVKARRAHKLETGKVESIYHFPGMETWAEVQERLVSFLNDTLQGHRGEHIAIVTHADPVLGITHYFTKEDPAKLCHQPYPGYAGRRTFFWDHDRTAEFDLHKDTIDDIVWPDADAKAVTEITLVRHGETDANKKGLTQGSDLDPSMNETGQKQIADAARLLKKGKFDGIVTSDMKRAKETADILSKELGLKILGESALLRERKFGDWNNKLIKDLLKDNPYPFEGAFRLTTHFKTPKGGESMSEFITRMEQAYEYLIETYPGKKLIVVGHSGVLFGLSTIVERTSIRSFATSPLKNGEVMPLELRPLSRRIPEVLDCWFESGSMPYAQNHFPFESNSDKPLGFPADFIAEGIDQTRGWFYTLTVLGAALFGTSPFKHCIVNGTVLAEDGKKMSKRLKNYPDPMELTEKHGADAVRFALMSSPAVRGEDLRFSEKTVGEQLRNVLLPLWNTYSFFVTYANAANFEPVSARKSSSHPLDRWIKTEIQDLVNRMTKELDGYDLSATCAELYDTIDALTNWYVRLSRRRFAGKSNLADPAEAMAEMHEGDRLAALNTLYDVLLTLSQLLAPFCPFVTESIYLNLVPQMHGSIHLTDWPATKELTKGERDLLDRTRVLRTVVSLGLQIRSDKKVKVRQPLARATVAVPASLLRSGNLSDEELSLLREELNVKTVDVVEDASSIAEAIAQVNARAVGPRLGSRVQEIIKAGKAGEFAVQDDGSVLILDERLTGDEVSIVYRGREGEDVAANHGVVVALETTLTPALISEGQARDLIRQVQQLRKDAGLQFTDHISLEVVGADELIKDHGKTIASATLATLEPVQAEDHSVQLENLTVTVRFAKA